MTDEEIIKISPLCVNVARLGAYLLAPDEVIFFDWIVTKSVFVFDFKPFYYSERKIEDETRIKRRTLERIIKRFTAFGFLGVETRPTQTSGGRNRYYDISFDKISGRLKEIVDSQSQYYKPIEAYFGALARIQKRKRKKGGSRQTATELKQQRVVTEIYGDLCDVWKSRIDMYNAGQLGGQEGKQPERGKPSTQLPRNGKINSAISRLSGTYDRDTIKGAFTAYADSVLCDELEVEVNDTLGYFLTYDEVWDQFGVFNSFLSKFQNTYSYAQ